MSSPSVSENNTQPHTQTRDKLLTLIQYFVPQHLLSRAVGWAAESRVDWVKNTFIGNFAKRYGVNMS
jgi:phosphatidylserine decarboxylase